MKKTRQIIEDLGTYLYVEIEWWEKEDFIGRKMKFFRLSDSSTSPELVGEREVPDDLILCDYCGKQIDTFPVPVLFRHALCPQCAEKHRIRRCHE